MLLRSRDCDFGLPAVDFALPGVDGNTWTLEQCRGPNGLLIMFICNHCPWVKPIQKRLVRDTEELKSLGIGSVAIMANDTVEYPEDSFENMRRIALEQGYGFPYLLDATQEVAQAYGAVCTPDFFGYNQQLELQYKGRLDAAQNRITRYSDGDYDPARDRRELFEAMKQIAETGQGPRDQTPSMGCSIKWRSP